MAVLDKSLIKIIGEKEYYRILAIMELQETQERNRIKTSGSIGND